MADAREHRALISPDGVAPASMVTDRDAADSAAFAKPCRQSAKIGRRRSGGSYLLGLLREAAAACRDPFFEPKKNRSGGRTNSWAEAVEFWKERPGRFYAVCKTTIETASSAVWRVRSVTPRMRDIAIVSTCRNIGA